MIHDIDQRVDAPNNHTPDHSLEKLFLGFEVQVQEPLADTCSARHFFDRGRCIALFGERFEGRVSDFLRAVFLAAAVAGLAHLNES